MVLRASGSRGSKRGGAAEVYRGQGGRSFNSDAKSYRRRVLPAERRRGTAGMSGAASLVLSSGMGGAGGCGMLIKDRGDPGEACPAGTPR